MEPFFDSKEKLYYIVVLVYEPVLVYHIGKERNENLCAIKEWRPSTFKELMEEVRTYATNWKRSKRLGGHQLSLWWLSSSCKYEVLFCFF